VVGFLREELENRGFKVKAIETKELLGVKVPSLIGSLPDEITYMLFWQAIRLQELNVITPALEEGYIVLCDRGPLSQFAYDWESLDAGFKHRIDEIYFNRCITPNRIYIFYMNYNKFLERDDKRTVLTEERFYRIQEAYKHWGEIYRGFTPVVYVNSEGSLEEEQKGVLQHMLCVIGGKDG